MKKIFILLLLSISATSFSQKTSLSLHLIKGATYSNQIHCSTSIDQEINSQKLSIQMTINGKMLYKVTDIKDTIYNLTVTYSKMAMTMNLPKGKMEFSSDKMDLNDIFSTIMGTLINKPFYVKMSTKGKILEVKNTENLFNDMFSKFPNLPDAQKQQIKAQLMQAYGDKAFKGNIEMGSAIFPNKPVSIGESWKIVTKLESGMAANQTTIYTLKEITNSYYLIIGKGEIVTANKNAYIKSNGQNMKVNMTGTSTSVIKLDKKSGWNLESTIKQGLKGTTHIQESAQMPNGMDIPMTMQNNMVITGE